jgi:hypothetical protein
MTAIANTWPVPSPVWREKGDQRQVAAVEHDLEGQKDDQR